jgi:SNF2 family DNA or RNA helicase
VVTIQGDDLVFDRSPQADAVAKVLGLRYDRARDAWKLAATMANAASADELLGTDARALVGGADPIPYASSDERLYPFQRDAAGWLASRPRGGILVASPGLGKTAISVVGAEMAGVVSEGGSVLVVAPASLIPTWWREATRWATRKDVLWTVVSWDTFARSPRAYGDYDLAILDESVMAKSRRAKRFRAALSVRARWGRVWLLSGNPTTRHADDLWTQLRLVWPRAFPSYWRFAERFCAVEETVWARTVVADLPGRDVMADNFDLVRVVNQEDVIDLPEYLFEVVDVDLTPRQEDAYESMRDDFVAELRSGSELVAKNEIARLQRLQQIVSYWDGSSAKHDALVDLVASGVYETPILVWSHWVEGAAVLAARLGALHVSGSTPAKARDEALERLRAGDTPILVLSIGVGKFGHTFTSVKTIVYVDKTWNADDYFQSLRRVRRIGLKHRPVVVTVRAPGTVDELVEANLEGKLGNIARTTRSRLAELLMGLGKG